MDMGVWCWCFGGRPVTIRHMSCRPRDIEDPIFHTMDAVSLVYVQCGTLLNTQVVVFQYECGVCR